MPTSYWNLANTGWINFVAKLPGAAGQGLNIRIIFSSSSGYRVITFSINCCHNKSNPAKPQRFKYARYFIAVSSIGISDCPRNMQGNKPEKKHGAQQQGNDPQPDL